MTQYINKLPAVFQTVTEKKFFDATFDQVFSKKDSEFLAGYLGRRNPGTYNPISDFYLPEPSKNRTWWQLEPSVFSRNADTTKSNLFFYEDMLDYIEYYGGNTQNQDRIFNSEYYSWCPPIDVDMFINYQNYYWVEQGLPAIQISGVQASDIIGQSSYTTPSTATPANFELTTGMTVILTNDAEYNAPHVVENIGGCTGIRLVPRFPDFTSGTVFEFLPWDGFIELSNGRIIDNRLWDGTTWDTQTQPTNGDYITIERGSLDRNAWSRTNKWFHIDAINRSIAATGSAFPTNATRAIRPIIQFIADLILYNSGTQFRSEITYGFGDNDLDQPLRLSNYQGRSLSDVNTELGISLSNGDLVCFFNDTDFMAWDMFEWELESWEEVSQYRVNQYIFQAVELPSGEVYFYPYTSFTTPVVDGDIVFVLEDGPFNSALRGETWYYDSGVWQKAFNDKVSLNQPPLFQLYDHEGIDLDSEIKYPQSSFRGSKIFSYKINETPGARVDPVLKFPIVYTALGQSSDIVFVNDLMSDRYVYGSPELNINGYYYYKTVDNPVLYNNWNLYDPCPCDDIVPPPPCNCITESKQRVIDKFVVGYGTEFQFKLSVTPYGYPSSPDLIVSVDSREIKSATEQVNGYTFVEINGRIYVDLENYLNTLIIDPANPPVVEVQTYTHGLLENQEPGYFQIPQQLEANPNQQEVFELSASNLYQHFSSVIEGQIGIVGLGFGSANNYRDTRKNRSIGQYILQNTAPLLKSMLFAGQGDLELIPSIRFSQDEYTKFKNRYIKTAKQMIDQEFNPLQYHNNTVLISQWVDEILKRVNVSKEFSNSFAYSYMVANGTPFASELFEVPLGGVVVLQNYVDLSLPENAVYFYDVTGQERLLTIGQDYNFVSTNLAIEVEFNLSTVPATSDIVCVFYKNPLPAYIPSTPSKVGTYPVYLPRMEIDTSFVQPTLVIIGHDGSKTVAYGDYRDQLLLELETRIYNLILEKFRDQYLLPLQIENVRPGYFRQTRYSYDEYLDITRSYLNKWAAKNRANYRANDWLTASAEPSVDPDPYNGNIWKLYNYRLAEDTLGNLLNLPGNWKGIFQYFYDTIYPNTRPWEMLGFSDKPTWWDSQYGAGVVNPESPVLPDVYPDTVAYSAMWQDIESGIIRQGPRAIYDPVTLQPQVQDIWARPGLSTLMPVDSTGKIRSVMSIFDVVYSGNPYAPFDNFDLDWDYGDGAPVEQAWMSNSGYAYSVQEILYLTQASKYGEYFWDTYGTELSPGKLVVPGVESPVKSNTNWQYVQNEVYASDNQFFTWMRPRNEDQIVHAEITDGILNVRYGYQRWISDRILFLGKDIADTFGQKVRTLDVNLANKFAGFTNKDTTQAYIESASPESTTSSLIIPGTNYQVFLHSSPVVDTYSYSGVIVRALADGTFVVYGYDLLTSEFKVLERADSKLIDISVGGTPAEFRYYESGATYAAGEIVRYNGIYYVSLSTQTVTKFDPQGWQKLKALPIVGGVSVTYKPDSTGEIRRVSYGTILKTAQDVFDLLIGWGDYLESQGWQFEDVDQATNQVSNWLASAKQFLFWLNTNWAPDAAIQLSPMANSATLTVTRGYPLDVESLSNGVYSILDKYGVAIPPNGTLTNRDGRTIKVSTADVAVGGIYYLQINASETEHAIVFDNVTSFNDTIYSPLLRARQQRIRFNGFRSNGWYGKMEAPGYLVLQDQLIPNYDTLVNSMRYYYDANVTIDNPSIEELGRHLIGYESKSYLDNLEVSNDVQYLFYKGAIRQKGTQQAFDKLFRSTKIQTTDAIDVYEEWALKVGDFGNTVDQVSTEFILQPEQNTGDVIVARLNYRLSNIGGIKQINVLNSENTYKSVPKIIVGEPNYLPPSYVGVYTEGLDYSVGSVVKVYDAQGNPVFYSANIFIDSAPATIDLANWTLVPGTENIRRAKAYPVLDKDGRISRVDISDTGYGYSAPVAITIDSGTEPNNLDRLYSVFQGVVEKDATLDNIIDIDIDNTDQWTVRPAEPEYSLVFPETSRVEYTIPNAGYVNFNDVDFFSFNPETVAVNWGNRDFNPGNGQDLWVAKNFIEDWNVYKLVDISQDSEFKVVADENQDIFIRTPLSYTLGVQGSTGNTERTDFGNLVSLQVIDAELSATITPAGLVESIQIDKTGAGYKRVPLIEIEPPVSGTTATAEAQLLDGVIVGVTITDPGSGYTTVPAVSVISPPIDRYLDGTRNYALPFAYSFSDQDYNYYQIQALDGTPITTDQVPVFADFSNLLVFKELRFEVAPVILPSYIADGDKVWVDNIDYNAIGPWTVYNINTSLELEPFRVQEKLIDTELFKSASIYSSATLREIVQLPVYDPFKDIFPGPAKQNISYISLQDPARYNVTPDQRLYSENITFAKAQVGKLWWDTSSTRFVYYEQPRADGETLNDNLVYRRDNWGRLFPGSEVLIYEWTESTAPPSEYVGPGVPRSTDTYVQVVTSNRFTNQTEVKFYFWVLNRTDLPNVENRTMPALDVARLLQSPKSQGFAFFAPIQQSNHNNSYMFYNVQEVLVYQGNNVQIEYRVSRRDDQTHTQWSLLREADSESLITDRFWNKMVDSLCGYTRNLPVSDEYSNGIVVPDSSSDTGFSEVLVVPDPTLSVEEKYGIEYRPRQGMFKNIYSARKVFVQAANSLLAYNPIRDDNPGWNAGVQTDIFWRYTTWYAPGYESVTPTSVYQTLIEASLALLNGQLQKGDIVQVTQGTVDGRFKMYAVVQPNENTSTLSLEEVAIEASAIELLDTVYTVKNIYALSVELRQLLAAFRDQVMIDNFFVDQNKLFFSMLNYVVSEQKDLDWAFKTSYIYIKENNLPLEQTQFYTPDQTENVIKYITDAKPYHTKIRDYTSTYSLLDVAEGTATDAYRSEISLEFGPRAAEDADEAYLGDLEYGWDSKIGSNYLPWDGSAEYSGTTIDNQLWDADTSDDIFQQVVSGNPVIPTFVPVGTDPWPADIEVSIVGNYDPDKKGFSALYPYTFDIPSLNNPQNRVMPTSMISVEVDGVTLIYGRDFYVEYNGDTVNYTMYFFEDQSSASEIKVFVWINGGYLNSLRYSGYRDENCLGDAQDTFVIYTTTAFPYTASIVEGNSLRLSIGDQWDFDDTVINSVIQDFNLSNPDIVSNIEQVFGAGEVTVAVGDINWTGGYDVQPWDQGEDVGGSQFVLEADESLTLAYSENQSISIEPTQIRNAEKYSANLRTALPAPTAEEQDIQSVEIIVDALTHPDGLDVLPPAGDNAVIWINGERIVYRQKEQLDTNIWKISQLERGSKNTCIGDHSIGDYVWVESGNLMPINSNTSVWNVGNTAPDVSSESIVTEVWVASAPLVPGEEDSIVYQEQDRVLYLGTPYYAATPVMKSNNEAFDYSIWTPITQPEYTRVTTVPLGGLWYSTSSYAEFLKQAPGPGI